MVQLNIKNVFFNSTNLLIDEFKITKHKYTKVVRALAENAVECVKNNVTRRYTFHGEKNHLSTFWFTLNILKGNR